MHGVHFTSGPPLLLALALAFPVTGSPWAAEGAGQQDDLKPEAILSRVSQVYATCRTYADEGRVKSQVGPARGEFEKPEPDNPFATAFVRPGRFRLDYRHNNGAAAARRSVIWTRKDGARSWWDLDGRVQKPESLEFALGAFAGVTSGVSTEIPGLLNEPAPGKEGRVARFSQFQGLKRLGDDRIDGMGGRLCRSMSLAAGSRSSTCPPTRRST